MFYKNVGKKNSKEIITQTLYVGKWNERQSKRNLGLK